MRTHSWIRHEVAAEGGRSPDASYVTEFCPAGSEEKTSKVSSNL